MCSHYQRVPLAALPLLILAMVAMLLVSARQADASGCANEGLRASLLSSRLPDCRAYELVSPAVKYGQLAEALHLSADGSHMIASSIAGVSGSKQTSLFSLYDLSRANSGWETVPLNPPTEYATSDLTALLAASSDLGSGLFRYVKSRGADPRDSRYYLRLLPDGAPVEVGSLRSRIALNPINEPSANTSTPISSHNLSRIVFTLEGPTTKGGPTLNYLWPGDATALRSGGGYGSLYEFIGTGNAAPSLVGIDNAGHQISQCGTSIGFPIGGLFTRLGSEELYNAVSSDGSRVFFTAAAACEKGAGPPEEGAGPPANELFARERLPSGESRTVPISEPSTGLSGDCAECNTTEPAGAVFQGASEDGSKVFFLSSQQLLTGAGGNSLYEYDFNARQGERLVLVAPDVQGVARVSEDGSHVYFVSQDVLTGNPNPVGRPALAGEDNLYVYADGQTDFVGALSVADGERGVWSQEDRRPVDATPDGRYILFMSSADLTPDDTSSLPQVFGYDAREKRLVRVSRPQVGVTEGGEFEASIVYSSYTSNSIPPPTPSSISADGSYVVFQSRAGLTPQAAVGYNNVYEYHDGRVSLISDGQDRSTVFPGEPGENPGVSLVGIDASGSDIFFLTADRLVPQDGDTQQDVYDARIGGGFPPPSTVSCEGDGCQGGLTSTPPLATALSASEPAGEQVSEAVTTGPTAKAKGTKKAKPRKRRPRRKSRVKGHRSSRAAKHVMKGQRH